MRLFRLLLLLLLSPLIAQAPYDDLREKVARFATAHNEFARELFGCPATGELLRDSCNPDLGIIDYGKFNRARKLASKLYSLPLE